jgi:hypothetical protein
MTATEIALRQLSRQQIAERVREYHRGMEPHITAEARLIGMLVPRLRMMSGQLVESVYSPEDQRLIDESSARLAATSKLLLQSLGLESAAC